MKSIVGLVCLCTVSLWAAEPIALDLPEVDGGWRIETVLGEVGAQLELIVGDAREGARLTITCGDAPTLPHHWQMGKLPETLKDGSFQLEVSGAAYPLQRYRKTLFVRPDPLWYVGEERDAVMAAWPTLAKASETPIVLELERTPSGLETTVNGRFFTTLPLPEGAPLSLTAPAPPTVSPLDPLAAKPIPLRHYPYAGDATLQDLDLTGELPYPLDPAQRIDVGQSRWLRQSLDFGGFYEPYYKRSAFDGVPESPIIRVPMRFYSHANLICAVEPGRSPEMTVRIGRYRASWDGGGPAVGDVHVRIDPENPVGLESIEQIGTVTVDREGTPRRVPVYQVRIPLATGEVADYLNWDGLSDGRLDWGEPLDWLMVEFSRRIETRVNINNGLFDRKPVGPRSGVQILAIDLTEAPLDLYVEPSAGDFVFYTDQDPQLRLHGTAAADLQLSAHLRDHDQTSHPSSELPIPSGAFDLAVPLADVRPGWYQVELLVSRGQETVWRQTLSIAMLPPDTRQATAESPFATWWFRGSHYTEPDARRALPLVQKLGFRHVTPGHPSKNDALYHRTPETYARFNVTPSMAPTMRGKTAAEREQNLNAFFELWPDTAYAMIFHETRMPDLGIDLPPELLGKKPEPLNEEQQQRLVELRDFATTYAATVRKLSPATRIMLGNSSTPFNIMWLREQLSRDVFDALGMEMAVQTMHPEGPPNGWNLQSLWIARRMADLYGYDDLPITACYEFDYRVTGPGGLSLQRQADWYARDVLHGLAYRMPTISVALLMDCNSSYYSSRWGSTGLCYRSPWHLPKPSYVTLATLTQQLDQATYQRAIPTGTLGLYVLEFSRPDGYVYAIWAGRGERDLTLTTAGSDPVLTHGMGYPLTAEPNGGALTLTASETPMYLRTTEPVTAVQTGAPRHPDPTLDHQQTITDLRDWQISDQADPDFADYCAYAPMQQAPMTFRDGKLTLSPQPDLPHLIGRYAILEPAAGPVPIPGEPTTLGVRVDGNAGWGRIYLQVEDAAGRLWTSNGWEEAPHSWDMSDWEADTSINHDGERLIMLDLPGHYPSGYYRPSFRHWRCAGNNATDNRLVYPLKLTRLYVVLREQTVYVTQMEPVRSPTIGLRDVISGTR